MARRSSRLSWSFSPARYSSCNCCKSSASASRSAASACPVCWAASGDLARIWRTIWRMRSESALLATSSARCASCSESAGFCSAVDALRSWSCSASRSVSRCKLPSCSCWRRPLWPAASSRLIWLWRRASSRGLLDDGAQLLLGPHLFEQGNGSVEPLLEGLLVFVKALEGVGEGLGVWVGGGFL